MVININRYDTWVSMCNVHNSIKQYYNNPSLEMLNFSMRNEFIRRNFNGIETIKRCIQLDVIGTEYCKLLSFIISSTIKIVDEFPIPISKLNYNNLNQIRDEFDYLNILHISTYNYCCILEHINSMTESLEQLYSIPMSYEEKQIAFEAYFFCIQFLMCECDFFANIIRTVDEIDLIVSSNEKYAIAYIRQYLFLQLFFS